MRVLNACVNWRDTAPLLNNSAKSVPSVISWRIPCVSVHAKGSRSSLARARAAQIRRWSSLDVNAGRFAPRGGLPAGSSFRTWVLTVALQRLGNADSAAMMAAHDRTIVLARSCARSPPQPAHGPGFDPMSCLPSGAELQLCWPSGASCTPSEVLPCFEIDRPGTGLIAS
jgi:hypothetical protein